MDVVLLFLMIILRKTLVYLKEFSQLTFYCLKSTIETLEKAWDMFKANNKNTRTTSLTSFWCCYCELWTYFTHFSSVPVAEFEQANVSWVPCHMRNETTLSSLIILKNLEVKTILTCEWTILQRFIDLIMFTSNYGN